MAGWLRARPPRSTSTSRRGWLVVLAGAGDDERY